MSFREVFEGDKHRLNVWFEEGLEYEAMLQALRSSRSSVVSSPVALMADAHVGRGATVGSVLVTRGAIIPAAVGVDLGCGMVSLKTSLVASDLPDSLDGLMSRILRDVPVGRHTNRRAKGSALSWMKDNPVVVEGKGKQKALRKASEDLGSLGGGNHFIEVCVEEGTEVVWVTVHSGSRGIGNWIARGHIERAKNLARDLERRLEDPDLAYFLESDVGYREYIDGLLWSQRYAFKNREIMASSVVASLRHVLSVPVRVVDTVNCHHNYADLEMHGGEKVWVTRKGAIKAAVGDRGVIPGSMGDGSYIVEGLGNVASYCSASHGAGRKFSRSDAKRLVDLEDFKRVMASRTWQENAASRLVDEAPAAYKSIVDVMAAQSDLVVVTNKIDAVLNVKGC